MNLLTMIRLRKHANGIYYIHYTRLKRETLGTRDQALAQKVFRKRRDEYLLENVKALEGRLPSKTLVDFWEEYEEHRFKTARPMTCATDRQAFRVFRQALGDGTALTTITRKQVETALGDLAQRVARTSANTWFRHFKAALGKAKEWGYLRLNPCDGVKQLRTQEEHPRFLTEEEFARLLAAEPDALFRLFWQFQVYSGARRRESLGVTVQDVKPELNRIDIGRTKNGKPKAIILNGHLRRILAQLNRDVGKLWPWQPDSVTHHFQRTARAAGLRCRLHDLRHTYGSWLVMREVPLRTVQILMGHQDSKTTEKYAHLSQKCLEEAASRL